MGAFFLLGDAPGDTRADVGRMAAPECFDIDLDGDIDCMIGERDGTVAFLENKGPRGAGGCGEVGRECADR